MEDIQGKNYFLFFDNFFSSPTLLADLISSQIYCVGTVAANRKEYPKFAKSRVIALERGQHIATQVLAKKVHCFVWKDRKPVHFVDTICKDERMDVVSRRLRYAAQQTSAARQSTHDLQSNAINQFRQSIYTGPFNSCYCCSRLCYNNGRSL